MNKILAAVLLFASTLPCIAQQYSLYNSRTLYDSFENPSQKAFVPDSSKKYAFNFFIPAVSVNAVSLGPQQQALKRYVFIGSIRKSELDVNQEGKNNLFLSSNVYLGMFKIFKDIKRHREIGFSWQIRSDSYLDATQQTIGLFKDFNNFNITAATGNPFKNTGNSQSYHQFGFTYREDITKRVGLGVKVSYLSGISYNYLKIKSSSFQRGAGSALVTLNMDARYRSNFLYDDPYQIAYAPGFTNPGMAVTLSANLKLKKNWYLLGNVKDLGFIRWGNNSYDYDFNRPIIASRYSAFEAELKRRLENDYEEKGFTSVTNGKVEILINKDVGIYQPNLLLSKSFLYKGTDLAAINNFLYKSSVFSLSAVYNTNEYLQVGTQYMFKTPNIELYVGSDNLFKTLTSIQGYLQEDPELGNGYTGASFYLGFSVKFGDPLQRRQNTTKWPRIRN